MNPTEFNISNLYRPRNITIAIERRRGSTPNYPVETMPSLSNQLDTPQGKWRIVLYSHDTMGLGHKRRNLLIAQTLGISAINADILMISGMGDGNQFQIPPGIDYLTLPALHKSTDGQYQARRLDISLTEIITLRSQIIRSHQETGLIVSQNKVETLAQALQKMLQNPTLRVKFATKARKLMELEFDIHTNATALRKLWQSSSQVNSLNSRLMVVS